MAFEAGNQSAWYAKGVKICNVVVAVQSYLSS